MEAARPIFFEFGFTYYAVDDPQKMKTAVCKVCSSVTQPSQLHPPPQYLQKNVRYVNTPI